MLLLGIKKYRLQNYNKNLEYLTSINYLNDTRVVVDSEEAISFLDST